MKRIQKIINHLLKRYFDKQGLLETMPPNLVLKGYIKMNEEDIINTLRYRFTNVLAEQVGAKKEVAEIYKGRLLELLGLFRDIENAEQNLVKYKEYEDKEKRTQDVLANIKSKLMGFKKPKTKNL